MSQQAVEQSYHATIYLIGYTKSLWVKTWNKCKNFW